MTHTDHLAAARWYSGKAARDLADAALHIAGYPAVTPDTASARQLIDRIDLHLREMRVRLDDHDHTTGRCTPTTCSHPDHQQDPR